MWSHTWQMACRVEQIPNVGDHVVYEVADKSLIVMRSAPTEIKAFFNVCLHRGRILRETGGHVSNLRCKFHGFTWRLDGKWPSKRFSKPGTCSRRIRRSFLLLAMQTRINVSKDQPHTSRLIIPMGVASPFVAESTSEQEILDGMKMQLGRSDELRLPPSKTARQYSAELMRERMSLYTNGSDFSQASDSEMLDALVYFVFPNFIMWGGYSESPLSLPAVRQQP